jgi:hypothetical protein
MNMIASGCGAALAGCLTIPKLQRRMHIDGWPRWSWLSITESKMDNTTMLYSLAAVYIALTEAIAEVTGKPVGPVADRLIEEMLPILPPDAAEVCDSLIKFAGSHPVGGVLGPVFAQSIH